jgi:hypothetical protein
MRNNKWLEKQMYYLWENYFADIPRKNLVIIKFGRDAYKQLGSIKWAHEKTGIKTIMRSKRMQQLHQIQDDKRITVITITKKFQNKAIPLFVVRSTIAHELCHYSHGFSSPEKKLFKYPHKGGIIKKELKKRKLFTLTQKAQKWLEDNWLDFVRNN